MSGKKKRNGIIIIVALVLLAVGGYMLAHMGEETTDDAEIAAHIVTLSPKVGGYIKTINVRDNQLVKTGDVLMEIDPADYIIRRDRAAANLDAAKARLAGSGQNLESTKISAPSNFAAAQAQVSAAEANAAKAAADLKRVQGLAGSALSRQQFDQFVALEKTARSNLQDARARLSSAGTAPKTIAAAQNNQQDFAAGVKQAEADLAQAEKDLADTKILAPMDGHITRKGVDMGDYVTPGEEMGYLVGVDLWVVANFKETQLKHMKPGQRVDIHVDAFPNAKLTGKLESIQSGTGVRFSAFPPENATGNFVKIVQRVPVKILLDKPAQDLPLGPGMSVVPVVYTE